MSTIHLIAAARPNFMKIAPLYHALKRSPSTTPVIVHTGQHYDQNMSGTFFEQLNLPPPAISLNVGSGSHAEQTGRTMIAYEKVCLESRPDMIVVVGDVNATLACALVGAKLLIPVAHLEAGLRSFDRTMPEEINRIATDSIADLLWTPSADGDENLLREGIPREKIEMVGNIMIDSLLMQMNAIKSDTSLDNFKLAPQGYAPVTLHRPSNVDSRETLTTIIGLLRELSADLPLVFPIHPRTRSRLQEFGLLEPLMATKNITLLEPLSYVPFMRLVLDAKLVITDSGGVQEETTYLGIPCITLRDSTERPITVTHGSNVLSDPGRLLADVATARKSTRERRAPPPLWDGKSAERVVSAIQRFLS